MKALLDTNILIRSINRADPRHLSIGDFLRQQVRSGVGLVISPQNVIEFWVVATRPKTVNGLGLGSEEAFARIEELTTAYTLMADPPGLLTTWLELCRIHSVLGRRAHDARLAVFMTGHGIARLITLDAPDIKRYRGIECVSPVPGVGEG